MIFLCFVKKRTVTSANVTLRMLTLSLAVLGLVKKVIYYTLHITLKNSNALHYFVEKVIRYITSYITRYIFSTYSVKLPEMHKMG